VIAVHSASPNSKAHLLEHEDGTGTYINARGEEKSLAPKQVASYKKVMPHVERPTDGSSSSASTLTPAASAPPTVTDTPTDRKWRSAKVRRTRAEVQPIADKLSSEITKLNPGLEFHFGGSWRRGASSVGDLDVVFVTKDGQLGDVKLPPSVKLERGGKDKIAQGDIEVNDVKMHVDFWSASEKERGAFLWFMTGPKELNISMRAEAKRNGMSLSQVGLLDSSGRQIDNGTEEDVARKLDPAGRWLKYLDPKARDSWTSPKPEASDVEKVQVESSKPGEFYTVTRSGSHYSCTCQAYKFRKTCKHIDKVKAEYNASLQAQSSAETERDAQQVAPRVPRPAAEQVLTSPTKTLVPRPAAPAATQPATGASRASDLSGYKPMTYMEIKAVNEDGSPSADLLKFIKDDDYVFQQKIDGHRGTLVIEPGKAPWMKAKHGGVYNQSTNNPLAASLASHVAKTDIAKTDIPFMVDGEMLNGKYHVFDLVVPGQESMPWEQRMKLAEQFVESMKSTGYKNILALPSAMDASQKRELWDEVVRSGREGVVIKRKDAKYKQTTSSGLSGKSAEVIKAKAWRTADVVVTAMGVGESSGQTGGTKDNVHFGVWDSARKVMIPVGGAALAGREKKLGRKLKIGDVIEVQYMDANASTFMLKQPQVIGLREDKTKEDTGTAQLQTVDKSLIDKQLSQGKEVTAENVVKASAYRPFTKAELLAAGYSRSLAVELTGSGTALDRVVALTW
jgi:hypothetical protein